MTSYKFSPVTYNTSAANGYSVYNQSQAAGAHVISMPTPVAPAANTRFATTNRGPFKHTVSLPGANNGGQGTVPQVNAATTLVQAAAGKPKPSIEEEYFQSSIKSGKFAARQGVLYQWSGIYWAAQDPEQMKKHAANWLRQFHPDRANPNTVSSCVSWLTSNAKNLPGAAGNNAIIPLSNAYLVLDSISGSMMAIKPDPKLGQTFSLNVKCPINTGAYIPSAMPANAMFRKFLESSLPDVDDQAYFQELCGYTLTNSTQHQVAIVLKGGGRNGKSVFVRLLRALHENVAALRLDSLKGFALMPLVGASLAVAEEMPSRGIDEQTLKAVITGEGVPIDRKYLAPITYESKAKIVIATNNDMRAKDNSDGLWRRFAIIPFNRQIPESEVVPNLAGQIIAKELDVFLNWCLEGLQRLTSRGKLPQATASMQAAKQAAILSSDPVAAWIGDNEVVVNPNAMMIKGVVFENYRQWSRENNRRALDSSAFWKSMGHRLPGIQTSQARIDGNRQYVATLTIGATDEPLFSEAGTPFDSEA
jgi:P4 family phage/plasmid primase-like protien